MFILGILESLKRKVTNLYLATTKRNRAWVAPKFSDFGIDEVANEATLTSLRDADWNLDDLE